MREAEISRFYRSLNEAKPSANREDAPEFHAVLGLFRRRPGGQLLDVGCYDGQKTERIARHTGATAHGIDFLPDRLATAAKRGIITREVQIGLQKLPFKRGFFDLVYCGDVIEHLFSPDALLEELFRVIKPSGQLVLTTPNLASWKNRIALLLGWQPFYSEVSTRYRVGNPRAPQGPPSGHIRMFTPTALRELLEKYGFHVTRQIGLSARSSSLLGKITSAVNSLLLPVLPQLGDELAVAAERVESE